MRVSYTGSLAASVKLYVSAGITNGTSFNLRVERGSGITAPAANMNCTGFTATSTAYDGALGSFGTTYAAGVDGKAAAAAWAPTDTVDYRFHDHPERRHDPERPHHGDVEQHAHVHLGGPQQLAIARTPGPADLAGPAA